MDTVFSGVQPTGHLHLGNYLGAIRAWTKLQDRYRCIFCVVDLHALTVAPRPDVLRAGIRKVAASYIASGIDPEKSIIFSQSAIQGHAHLQWILACMTPLGWLNRMTQFKEKAGKKRDHAVLGLYAYPVLMASDILLYQARYVPVGEDQKQHLELARDIAAAFNQKYDTDALTMPEPLIGKTAPRVMSLRDGTAKMSKSDISAYSRIHLDDGPDDIKRKIRKAKTDSMPLPDTEKDMEQRPEAHNLLSIYAALSDVPIADAYGRWGGKMFQELKVELTDLVIAKITPIGDEMRKIGADGRYLDGILKKGADKAAGIAHSTLNKVAPILGLSHP